MIDHWRLRGLFGVSAALSLGATGIATTGSGSARQSDYERQEKPTLSDLRSMEKAEAKRLRKAEKRKRLARIGQEHDNGR